MNYHSPVNTIGAFENYLLAIGWIVGWLIERHSIKKLEMLVNNPNILDDFF